jgi:serine/threonine protein kinase
MNPSSAWQFSSNLEAAVAAFEEALARDENSDPVDFLPEPGSPLFTATLQELLRVDLEFHWSRGEPVPLKAYRSRFPEFFADRANVQAVAFEEYRLRRQAGENPTPEEYAREFGVVVAGWPEAPAAPPAPLSVQLEEAAQAYRAFRLGEGTTTDSVDLSAWYRSQTNQLNVSHRIFADLHASSPELANRLAEGVIHLPGEGEEFLGFRLLRLLGRGAFGRVFLARQAALADRPVVLKIGPDLGGEPEKLAQLQHTHIVPIYSVHQSGTLQAVCMPFLGALTLADIEQDLRSRASVPLSGRELLSSLRQRPAQPASSWPKVSADQPAVLEWPRPAQAPPSAILKKLEGLSYVEAVLWLGCCLAEGLAHAHERGIFHRDVKPANVLITDEGQPMLLDFNLAADTKLTLSAREALIGGTLHYMAPEHLRAFQGDAAAEVDGRADIYSLGLILYELLTGQAPFGPPTQALTTTETVGKMVRQRTELPASPRRFNRLVSPAAAAIVRRCLQPDLARRYQAARH